MHRDGEGSSILSPAPYRSFPLVPAGTAHFLRAIQYLQHALLPLGGEEAEQLSRSA